MNVEQPRARAIVTPRGFVLLLIVGGLMFSSVYPLRRYMAVRSGIESLQQEEAGLQARIDELLAERERLLSDADVERRAREELGMVRPGEIPFVVAAPKPDEPPPSTVDPSGLGDPVQPQPAGVLERWWDALRRAAGA